MSPKIRIHRDFKEPDSLAFCPGNKFLVIKDFHSSFFFSEFLLPEKDNRSFYGKNIRLLKVAPFPELIFGSFCNHIYDLKTLWL